MSVVRLVTPARIGIASAVLVLLSTAVAIPTAIVSAGAARAGGAGVSTAGFPRGPDQPGIFTDTCARTRTAADDPIMMPGKAGMAMRHDFYGSPTVTAATTTAELRGGPSRCSTSADASAYWTPVLSRNGAVLRPDSTLLYWVTRPDDTGTTRPMPTGITLIAGNAAATAPQDPSIAAWSCTAVRGATTPTPPRSAAPRDCAPGSRLRLTMTFPECWDGRSLDGAKQTTAVYDVGGRCPADHPVRIPQLVLHVGYPTSSADGLELSTGPDSRGSTDTAHADFMNGWDDERMAADTAACIVPRVRCGRTVGALATPLGGVVDRRVRGRASGT